LRLNDIIEKVNSYLPEADVEVIKRAYVYSAKVHTGQKRVSGEPYLSHPLEVAGILADIRLDVFSIATGLLHDTIEDTLAKPEEIEALCGKEVALLVVVSHQGYSLGAPQGPFHGFLRSAVPNVTEPIVGG